ncbi:MAG: hypothetical protein ACXAB7_16170 [Candidatus Kariarchaeaceae archaeon]|jgi:hypothetical protein
MFRRRKKEAEEIELPPMEQLQEWVLILIKSLKLEEGSYTILPAYGGILLFVRNEGITWIPYVEIRNAIGAVDKVMLADTSGMLGGAAIALGTGYLPFILVHNVLKGSYRTAVSPPPIISRTFLRSMIKEVVLQKRKIPLKLLKTFERDPFKEPDKGDISAILYRLSISRKFLDVDPKKSVPMKVLTKIKSFVSRSIEPVFTIPVQADVNKFAEILEANKIVVRWETTEEFRRKEEI